MECERDFCLKATELRLGLPGSGGDDDNDQHCKHQSSSPLRSSSSSFGGSKKRAFVEVDDLSIGSRSNGVGDVSAVEIEAMPPPTKAQIVGWPPVRSYRKNNLMNAGKKSAADSTTYVKVSMDGAPYLRKIDINLYKSYPQLLKALNEMFNIFFGEYSGTDCYKGSEFAPTYEDKDGDWMLVGDVPWEMFVSSCKRLRIMRGADAKGLRRWICLLANSQR